LKLKIFVAVNLHQGYTQKFSTKVVKLNIIRNRFVYHFFPALGKKYFFHGKKSLNKDDLITFIIIAIELQDRDSIPEIIG